MTTTSGPEIMSSRSILAADPYTGELCCVLPDANSVTQRQCVEIGMVR